MQNAVDFDDLLGLTVALLRDHEGVRSAQHARFRHVLVDEFQARGRREGEGRFG